MWHKVAGSLPSSQPPAPSESSVQRQQQILLGLRYRQLTPSDGPPLGFDDIGFNVYSATGEDGILLYIFARLGLTDRRCVDIGAGAIEGSNVANLLLHHGFTGLLVDGNPEPLEAARAFYARHPETALFPPKTAARMVTAESVDELLAEHDLRGDIDLLCLDIDGIDYWVWKALSRVRPRVVVVEYQDILGPERAWTVPNEPDFDARAFEVNRQHQNFAGASLRAFAKLGEDKGYRLVGCNRGGWNAFFVRAELDDPLLPTVSIESCFRCPWNRYGMEERFPLVEHLPWVEV